MEREHRAFAHKGFRFYWFASLTSSFSANIVAVAVGWQIYDLTREPLYLGLVGLALFVPSLLLVLVTGIAADRYSRRLVLGLSVLVESLATLGLLVFTLSGDESVWPIFALLVAIGVGRAFTGPASSALVPNLVPAKALSDAVAVNSSAWQTANIAGPMAGGLLYGVSGALAYGGATVLGFLSVLLVLLIPRAPRRVTGETTSLSTFLAGFGYIWREKVVLGAISLDLFAVLLGGAVALLPVYARDILDVGPWGLGLLRAAPGVGAIVMAVAMHKFPIRDHAGRILVGFVFLFGGFTVVFGLATSVWIAVPALLLVGATDMVSVVVRETLIQLWTPDELRGRVSAVNWVFIGASNEVGAFRADVVAAVWGAVFAVTVGGVGTMAVAGLWVRLFPKLYKQRGLDRKVV